MTPLNETVAERHLAAEALCPAAPGFVGLAVDLLLAEPGLPLSLAGSLTRRPPLRHGYVTARSARVIVASGPPSPGLDVAVDRMAEDLAVLAPMIDVHRVAVLGEAADMAPPPAGRPETVTAGVRVCLEAGVDDDGPGGLHHRWTVACAVAPVLAAAFANAPLIHGRPSGWRSVRQAARRFPEPPPAGRDARHAWAAYVLDAPAGQPVATLRQRIRTGQGHPLTPADLDRYARTVRPPVAARGHLELDVADRQPGDGWRVPAAVITALVDDPSAATDALLATAGLSGQPGLWERAARHGLSDPALARAARDCFLSAYAALSRRGAARDVRDAVADFTERYVLRGRCPADDVLDRTLSREHTGQRRVDGSPI